MLDDDEKNKTINAATHNQLIIILIFFFVRSSSSSLAAIVCWTMSFLNHFVSRLKTFPSFLDSFMKQYHYLVFLPRQASITITGLCLAAFVIRCVVPLLLLPGLVVCVSMNHTHTHTRRAHSAHWKHSARESNSRINLIPLFGAIVKFDVVISFVTNSFLIRLLFLSHRFPRKRKIHTMIIKTIAFFSPFSFTEQCLQSENHHRLN